MKITLDIDDDVLQAAREMAGLKNQSIGRAISDLVRRGLIPDAVPVIAMQDGIPVWIHGPGAREVTSEMVSNLAEGEY